MTESSPDTIAPVEVNPTGEVSETGELAANAADVAAPPTEAELKQKFVKYAMRNMVKKRGKSLQHFFLSTAGLLALFIGLAYLTR
jgi:hypothetical protein